MDGAMLGEKVALVTGVSSGLSRESAGACVRARPAAPWLRDPADVARPLVLLAADDAATIRGALIAIDHATSADGLSSGWVLHQSLARA
jgi:hypothetical protein